MTLFRHRSGHHDRDAPSTVADEELQSDWIGLAGYLAESVAAGDISLETATAELAADANGPAERRALGRAAEFASAQFGNELLTTTLLQGASQHASPAADVA